MADSAGAIFRAHSEEVHDRVLWLTGSHELAEEITSAAFEKLLNQIRDGITDNPRARLFDESRGIIISLLADHWRKSDRRSQAGFSEEPSGLAHDLDELALGRPLTPEMATFGQDFDRAVRALAEPERASFILTELRGAALREAAALLGLTHPTVLARANAARALIREELSA